MLEPAGRNELNWQVPSIQESSSFEAPLQPDNTAFATLQSQQVQDPFASMMYETSDIQVTDNTFYNATNSMTVDFELMGTGDLFPRDDQWFKPG